MTNEKAIAERLLQIGAVKLNAEKPYTWVSGWKSPIYCDNRLLLSYPDIRNFIKREMCKVIYEQFPDADILAGVATAGIAWGAMAADQLKLPYIYVRPKLKEHGMGNQIEGDIRSGNKVLVIEDLISTAKSSLLVLEVLKTAGFSISGMLSIFTYDLDVAKNAIEETGIKYKSLTNYTALVERAIETGFIKSNEKELLFKWRKDPAHWQGI
jgi:orotate phosphoribosyltransferase